MSKTGPLQAARLFLMSCQANPTGFDAARLGQLIEEFAIAGYMMGLEEAKGIYRELHPGGCKMLSQGEACQCFLCQADEKKAKVRGEG